MNNKIAIGIINTYDNVTYKKCVSSLPEDAYKFTVNHTTDNISDNYNRYMSYGSLYNTVLRKLINTDATYLFLIKSNLIIQDKTIFQDYIDTARAFGTWFMSRGGKNDKYISVEDDVTKLTLKLYENLNQSLIFMLKSHVTRVAGFFDEGYINIDAKDDVNSLEIYDFYNILENKINYLPKGYFPDIDLSLAKAEEVNSLLRRPSLMANNTNNITKIYGKFYYKNKFVPGQHKLKDSNTAIKHLEEIQKAYSIKL